MHKMDVEGPNRRGPIEGAHVVGVRGAAGGGIPRE